MCDWLAQAADLIFQYQHLQLLSMLFLRLETPISARIKGKGAHKNLVLMNAGNLEPYFSVNFCLFGFFSLSMALMSCLCVIVFSFGVLFLNSLEMFKARLGSATCCSAVSLPKAGSWKEMIFKVPLRTLVPS